MCCDRLFMQCHCDRCAPSPRKFHILIELQVSEHASELLMFCVICFALEKFWYMSSVCSSILPSILCFFITLHSADGDAAYLSAFIFL